MTSMKIFVVLAGAVLFAAGPAPAVLVYDDGAAHEIAANVGDIAIYDAPGGAATTVTMVAGGRVREADVFGHSVFVALDGVFGSGLYLHDYSRGEVSGGIVGEDPFVVNDYSRLTITGGAFGEALLCYDNSQVVIYGSDFKIDDVPVDYGAVTAASGVLTGELLAGGQIDSRLSINGAASVVLVPEPATLVLLCVGGAGLLRRRR